MASKFQLGYDDERFETIVNRNFHCLICYNVLKEPVMCRNNQHYFCHDCITEHLRRNSHTCPTCADDLTVETLTVVPRIVQDYLDELNIRCDYYDRGCQELVQLQNLKQHVAECGFTPVLCGNQQCGEIINKRDRAYHETELCQFRKVECHNCGEISTTMAGMKTEIVNLNTRLANINTNQEHMRTEMANMCTEIANINTNQEHMGTEIANINTNQEHMGTEIANINTNQADMRMKMAHADTKLQTINKQMENWNANVEAKFQAVNNEVKEIKTSLDEVKDSFEQLKKAVLEKIEDKERKQEEITEGASGTASGKREKQHIFVAGGFGTNSVEIFDYHQRLWSLLKRMPEKRWRASSFVYNNHVTLVGGTDYFGFAFNDMIQMNVHPIPGSTINWSDFAAKLPAKMYAHSSVVYKDSLFLFGGCNKDKNLTFDCIFNIQLKPPYTVKLVAKMPEPRAYHSTVLCDDNILIIGGTTTGNSKDSLSSVLSYDIKKNECRQLPALPYAVSEMATVKWAENVVIIGGADKDDKALDNVIIYNTKTGNSHMLPPMLHKRAGCMAVVIQNTIVVLGGYILKSVEGFSFESYSWEELPDMNEKRWFSTAVAI